MMSYWVLAVLLLMLAAGCAHKEAVLQGDVPVTAPPAAEQSGEDISASVRSARDAVLDYFKPAEGSVEAVESGVVTIRLTGKSQVQKGMRLSVYREGAPFYHPVTNELIGYAEDFVGRIELTEDTADAGLFSCRAVSGDIRAGDKVRVSSSRIKLAFFQDRKANWSVSEAFYGALKESGRFEIVEAYTPDYAADTLSKVARGLDAEAVLMFSTSVKDGKRLMSVKLYWAEDSKMLTEIEEAAGESYADILAPDEEFLSTTFKDTKPWRRFRLPAGILIAMGDVDGNGIDEFVTSDGRDIRVYSAKDELQELWHIKAHGDGRHLALDILDVNGNGRAEIFVTSVRNAEKINTGDSEMRSNGVSLNSFVLEYDPSEGYKTIEQDMPYFLNVSGSTLLMQGFNINNIFSGPVYVGEWNDTQYKPVKPVNLPEMANIYGFTFVDWDNDGRHQLVTFDDDGYLYLFDENGKLAWRSGDSYGPFTFTFESRTHSIVNPTVKWSLRGRLEVVNTERGQEVVVVSRKPLLAKVPGLGYYEANVYTLRWDGAVMDEQLLLEDVSGSVTDYWVQGKALFLVAKGDILTFLSSIKEGVFSRGSILYYYMFAQ